MRVESEKPVELANGRGWIHRASRQEKRSYRRPSSSPVSNDVPKDWDALSKTYCTAPDTEIYRLAVILGVRPSSLRMLHCGHTGDCWTFPMRDHTHALTGILRRYPDGSKRTMRDSRIGLFYAPGAAVRSPIIICEGPTDVAALLDVGIYAIGRPSNRCRMLEAALLVMPWQLDIVVLGERDQKEDGFWPGKEGAVACADELCKRLDLPVPAALPPEEFKDARDWTRSGASREEIIAGLEYQ